MIDLDHTDRWHRDGWTDHGVAMLNVALHPTRLEQRLDDCNVWLLEHDHLVAADLVDRAMVALQKRRARRITRCARQSPRRKRCVTERAARHGRHRPLRLLSRKETIHMHTITPPYTLGRTSLDNGRPGFVGICQRCGVRGSRVRTAGMVADDMHDHRCTGGTIEPDTEEEA